MDHDAQPDAHTSVEQPDLTSTNPRSSKYATTRSRIVMTTTDIVSVPQPSTERIHTLSGNPRNALCGKPTYSFKHSDAPDVTTEHYRQSKTNFDT